MSQHTQNAPFVIGILSDTHGPVPDAALQALAGVDHILHAGDIVNDTVIDTLRTVAPVTAVRGNMDRNAQWPRTQYIPLAGINIYMLHDLFQLDIEPARAEVAMVVHGHTHHARIEWQKEVLYINPGSAGQPRGGRPASIAKVTVSDGNLVPEIVRLRL